MIHMCVHIRFWWFNAENPPTGFRVPVGKEKLNGPASGSGVNVCRWQSAFSVVQVCYCVCPDGFFLQYHGRLIL